MHDLNSKKPNSPFAFMRIRLMKEISILLLIKICALFVIYQIWFSQARITQSTAIEAHLTSRLVK